MPNRGSRIHLFDDDQTSSSSHRFFSCQYRNEGWIQREISEEEKAIEAYQRLIELSPESEIANYHLAGVYMFKKNYREAIKYLEHLSDVSSENAEVYFRLGHCFHNLGEYTKAIQNYKRALELNPDNSRCQEMLDMIIHIDEP